MFGGGCVGGKMLGLDSLAGRGLRGELERRVP